MDEILQHFSCLLFCLASISIPEGRTHAWLSKNKHIKIIRPLKFNYDDRQCNAQLIIVLDMFDAVFENTLPSFDVIYDMWKNSGLSTFGCIFDTCHAPQLVTPSQLE